MIGDDPGGRHMPNISIIGDNLYIYGGEGDKTDKNKTKDIFVHEFGKKSMKNHSKIA